MILKCCYLLRENKSRIVFEYVELFNNFLLTEILSLSFNIWQRQKNSLSSSWGQGCMKTDTLHLQGDIYRAGTHSFLTSTAHNTRWLDQRELASRNIATLFMIIHFRILIKRMNYDPFAPRADHKTVCVMTALCCLSVTKHYKNPKTEHTHVTCNLFVIILFIRCLI